MKVLFLSLFLLSLKVFAEGPVPQKNVVKGCPCLDCPYFVKGHRIGKWTAKKMTNLFADATVDTPTSTTLMPGDAAIALKGELHVIPGKLKILFAHGPFNLRDTVYLIQEDAEAKTWKLWYNGKVYYEDLSGMVGAKANCRNPSEVCWAKVIEPIKTEWWINLRTQDHHVGWINTPDDFDFDRSSCM